MSVNQYSMEELKETAWIEIAFELLQEKKQAVSFEELVADVLKVLKLNKKETSEKMIQFYTDLNLDGRFLGIGDNRWGLRVWYPVDQAEEDTVTPIKPRKKKAKKAAVDEVDGFDEIDEEDVFDDFDEDDDDLLDDDDDFDDDDDEDDDDDDFDDDDIIEDEDELELDEDELDDEDEDESLDEEEEL
ncbi:DNA-directed RNA polymerase subunit delta [Mesobacillus maritimus]|uniref:Probable DNA-directed RNA polymerase subunit delta n=1 Tax=Mesobacillus maritimus TaxID=1643336 RepID=A0ABS7K596_9BACI|nr:DNA-directed RNA polymerase subunit delta [Mesobacillus maritimus]MBY0097438.1 DNA-directed RNA polymerase subunit delta [Mesobacillus maritimus]